MFFNKKSSDITSPYIGKYIKLENVSDPAFASKAMGDGFAVVLTSGEVKSPVDGTIMMCFPTKHAYGIADDNGTEYLLHIGVDTVTLEGDGFETFVKVGDKITKGQLLCKVNLEYLKEKNISAISKFIVTNKSIKNTFDGTEVDHTSTDLLIVKQAQLLIRKIPHMVV